MAIEFLSDAQRRQYGRFEGEPDESQLTRYFHLDNTDLELTLHCRRDYNRLGFALQLTTVRFLGTFLSDPTQVPRNAVHFVARQLGVAEVNCLAKYMDRNQTRYTHRETIQQRYGYHEFAEPPWRFRLSRILYSRAWISNERPSVMFDLATAWLIQNKVLLPGATRLQRLITEIRERASSQLWKRLSSLPSEVHREKLETLLEVPSDQRVSRFDRFRQGPITVSGPAFVAAVERYLALRDFGLQALDCSRIPPVRLKALARHAGVISMHKIARMPDDKRIAILVAFVKAHEISALDDALDVLDLLIADIAGKAKNAGKKKRMRTLKDLDKHALIIAEACAAILNEETDSKDLRATIYARHPRDKLAESIAIVTDLARPHDDQWFEEMIEQYGRVKRFLQKLLHSIQFENAAAGQAIMAALDYLTELGPTRKQTLPDAPTEIVSKPWRRLVYDDDGRVDKRGYTLCFLDNLQDGLRRRDVYVDNSDRWGDPRAKLLQEDEWQSHRVQICRSLDHSLVGREAIASLTERLDIAYKKAAADFTVQDEVYIDRSGRRPSLTIPKLDKLEEAASLVELKARVHELLPKIDLTELLLEIDALTGLTQEFTHVSESNARVDDLPVSTCAVLLAEACNIGMEPLIDPDVPALTRHRLSWVKQNYVRAETIARGNARLVDRHSTLDLAKRWGGGDVASADGMRFITPVQTIHAGRNPKYFKRGGKGITWYNLLSDQFSGLNGIPIPGTLRDSIYVLELVLEQQTGLSPTEIMTDTSGASDMIFGLFWLLGYQFSPRLADAGEARFWRVDREADYGPFNELARNCINTSNAERHWDDILRIIGSLKLGTVHASELIRSLLKSDRPSSLAKAIIEVGRINKTIYLLRFVTDKNYRRRILRQLNRTESRHSVAAKICHGKHGEIRKRYREGQEDQLGALGLVVNALVLWNTVYMQDALDHLQLHSIEAHDEDVARLSPLLHEHVRMLGHYTFTLAEPVQQGEHRPLNQMELEFGEDLESILEALDFKPDA